MSSRDAVRISWSMLAVSVASAATIFDLTGGVRETMQPVHVSLWLREASP